MLKSQHVINLRGGGVAAAEALLLDTDQFESVLDTSQRSSVSLCVVFVDLDMMHMPTSIHISRWCNEAIMSHPLLRPISDVFRLGLLSTL